MSAGSRRNGTRKTGPFARPGHSQAGDSEAVPGAAAEPDPAGRRPAHYTARHATPRAKTARWAGKAVPAAAIAATLAAGTAAYGLAGDNPAGGSGKSTAALNMSAMLGNIAHDGLANVDAAAAREASADRKTTAASRAAATSSPSRPAAAPTATAKPAASAKPAQAATTPPESAGPVSCSGTSSLLPDNVTAIVNFLLSNGYSHNAAAGIAGNIYQESKGNPESVGSGGGGLIGWTPLRAGFVTGNPAADLQTQLAAILTYNDGWSAYIPALNAAATPAAAADIYVYDFERAGIPAAGTREASAEAVASACGL